MTKAKTIESTAPTIESVRQLYQQAHRFRDDFALQAVITGQAFAELCLFRVDSHQWGNFKVDSDTAQPDPTIMELAAEICGPKAEGTLYRWRDTARAVISNLLRRYHIPAHPIRHPDADHVLISAILTADSPALREFPAPLQAFREQFDAFMADKTLKDANIAALEGFDPAHRVTRAANGALLGGAGEQERKDFPVFIARHFRVLGEHFSHWTAMSEVQKTEAKAVLRAFFIGEEVKLPGRAGKEGHVQFSLLPPELREYAREAILESRKKTPPAA